METINVDLGAWVNVMGVLGHVCGAIGGEGNGKTSLDVCFRPHEYEGYLFADHRVIDAPFLGVSVVGKMDKPPFDPYEAKDRKRSPFG